MKTVEIEFTHKGWFGVCPIYIADTFGDEPKIDARYWLLTPALIVSEWIYATLFILRSAINPQYEPAWPIMITEKLDNPVKRVFHEHDGSKHNEDTQ